MFQLVRLLTGRKRQVETEKVTSPVDACLGLSREGLFVMAEFDRVADIYDVTRKRSDETMGPAIEAVETAFETLNLVSRRA